MYTHNFDPVIVDLIYIQIRWYSLAYIFGILFGWWIGKKILFYRTDHFEKSSISGIFDDYISTLILSIIIGGRLGYVLFYDFNYYINNFFEIIKIWKGGMSFHGALIGVIISTYFFTKSKKIETLVFLDIVACVAPIGLFFGRIANFINSELYGKPTEVFWSVVFPNVDILPRHPSQIYEAILEGVLLFAILITLIFNKKTRTGICSSLFLILYGIFRIIAEQFREPDAHIGYLLNYFTLGSLLSFAMIFFGIILLYRIINVNKKV